MKKFKIGYFGDGPWAHEAFKKIMSDKSLQIDFVCVRYDLRDPILIQLAEENKVDILIDKNINAKEFMTKVSKYKSDLFVSMSFNQIFKRTIIETPKEKTINCHAGKLPFYRGRNILNWALINDEKEFGITVHYIDEGIDTGDIILQRTFPITDKDNYSTLLKIAYIECANILYDAIKMIQNRNFVVKKQVEIDPNGFYCGIRTIGDENLNWNQTSRVIFNFVRA
ncbi:MAG: formyltransferase family protein, partial [Eubacterium sp.]